MKEQTGNPKYYLVTSNPNTLLLPNTDELNWWKKIDNSKIKEYKDHEVSISAGPFDGFTKLKIYRKIG